MYKDDTQVPQLKPTLHEEFHVGDEVQISNTPGVDRGTIVGIAFSHVVFSYIVELPEPLNVPDYPGKNWKCVAVVGGQLKLLSRPDPKLEECDGPNCKMPIGCTECNPNFSSEKKEEELKKALYKENDDSFQEGDVHQAILNIGYSWWQKKENESKNYGDMIDWVQFNYGDLAAFAILAGKYNQQVCNGGHIQYYDNGYASGSGWSDTEKEKCQLHDKMVELFESLGFNQSEIGSKVYSIMSEFEIDSDYEYDDEWNDEDDEDYDEYCDNGELVYFVTDGDMLDSKYYKVNDEWIKFFNEVLKNRLCT